MSQWKRAVTVTAVGAVLAAALQAPAGAGERGRHPSATVPSVTGGLVHSPSVDGSLGPDASRAGRLAATNDPEVPTPAAYLEQVLDLVEQYAIYSPKVDWPAVRAEARRRAAGATTTAGTYDAIRYVLAELKDNHSGFFTPEETKELLAGSAGYSFGLVAFHPENVVIDVQPGSAAARAGVKVGDVITSVDGRRPLGGYGVVALPAAEADRKPGRVRLRLDRGGRTLRVTVVARIDSATRRPTVTVAPRTRTLPATRTLELFSVLATTESGDNPVYTAAAHTGLKAQRTGCGWIVDLRRNSGGAMGPMLVAAGPVLGEGYLGGYKALDGSVQKSVYRRGRLVVDGQVIAAVAKPAAPSPVRAPVAVLTSRITASSGEAVVMAFRGRPNARSFGEPTAGVPTGNAPIPLPDGALLNLTSAYGLDRLGRTYADRIAPDQTVRTSWRRVGTPGDPVVLAARAWLKKKCSS